MLIIRSNPSLLAAILFIFLSTFAASAQTTSSPSPEDLIERAKLIAEITKLTSENQALKSQITTYQEQITLYKQLDALQESRVADLKAALNSCQQAQELNNKIIITYEQRIGDYKAEVAKLQTQLGSCGKKNNWLSIFKIALSIVGILH